MLWINFLMHYYTWTFTLSIYLSIYIYIYIDIDITYVMYLQGEVKTAYIYGHNYTYMYHQKWESNDIKFTYLVKLVVLLRTEIVVIIKLMTAQDQSNVEFHHCAFSMTYKRWYLMSATFKNNKIFHWHHHMWLYASLQLCLYWH